MKKILPSLVCGFGAGVLLVTPIIKIFTCCLIIPFAAVLSIVLDQKANPSEEKVTVQKGIVLGLLTGLFAGLFGTFFEVFITYITHSNDFSDNLGQMNEMWETLPQDAMIKSVIDMFNQMAKDIQETGFSFPYSLFLLANNLISGVIFGLLGGLLGMKIVNTGKDRNINDFN